MLSTADMLHLARLARLEPDPTTLDLFAKQCADIVTYMGTLSQVDTTGISPMYSPSQHPTPYREDVAVAKGLHEAVLSNAPQADADFFIVPRIV